MVTCLVMCTGNFMERDLSDAGNGIQRPPAGTKCAEPCVFESGRWGSSWCSTDGNGQWGAECVSCGGMIHFQVSFIFSINFYLIFIASNFISAFKYFVFLHYDVEF